MILIDSNVAIDLLDRHSPNHDWARAALQHTVGDDGFFNHIVVAELAARAESPSGLAAMLDVLAIRIDPLDEEISFCAGQAFKAWIKNGGRRGALLPDLIIGAHAAVRNAAILTRDPRRFRTYFPLLELITPEPDHD